LNRNQTPIMASLWWVFALQRNELEEIWMRVRKISFVAVFCAGVMIAGLPLRAEAKSNCTVKSTEYLGWKAEEMANQLVKLEIVPQLGGRLMQVTMGGHDYLFVNDQLKGQVIDPATAGKRWNNYGGDKIWPMPEGNEDEQHWAGAGGEPLDNAPFTLEVISKGATCTVRLTGPVDEAIGQQYIRDISISADSAEISFHAVMKNVSGYPQSWSEQSVSQYNAASPTDKTTFNPDFWGEVSANPMSSYLNGYHVRTGNASNPGYMVKDGLFKLHWNNIGGEVWTDTTGGWAAVVDGTTGYTMVERIRYDASAKYPDKTTILFFTTGQSNRRQNPNAANAPARPTIYYMETEVNSPVVTLYPGESYAMDTQWYPTRMGSDFTATTYSGVVGKALGVAGGANGLTLSGEFGVFFAGNLVAHYYGRGGDALGAAKLDAVSPLQPVILNEVVQAPEGTARVSLHVVDAAGLDHGPLGKTLVNPQPPDTRGARQ
jgi:hypothetical protein